MQESDKAKQIAEIFAITERMENYLPVYKRLSSVGSSLNKGSAEHQKNSFTFVREPSEQTIDLNRRYGF
jgi:hypothetical protein